MDLTITFGQTVTAQIDGHSTTNGAVIPDGSTVAVTSSDATIATVGAVTIPAGGAQSVPGIPVTVLGIGATTLSWTVTDPTGKTFSDTGTLTVQQKTVAGLDHITVTLTAT